MTFPTFSEINRSYAKQRIKSFVKHGEFTLRCGVKSDVYLDVKEAVCSDPDLFENVIYASRDLYSENTHVLAGMELGAVPLVSAFGFDAKISFIIVRKESKTHGITESRLIGPDSRGYNVTLIEDVTTTGHSLLEVSNVIKSAGGVIIGALTIVDREMGAKQLLLENGIELKSMFTLSELV